MPKTVEFRGCDSLVVAEITQDDATGYAAGTVIPLAPVAEIAKTTESSSETHYYDNTGMIVIRAEGSDEVTLTVPALALSQLSIVTGKTVDPVTGAYIDNEGVEKYYALGYRLKLTDGTYRYVWRLRGMFSNVPDETSSTESDSVDTNNQEVVFTGSKTIYEFPDGGGAGIKSRARAIVIDEHDGKCDLSTFFNIVQTPQTISSLVSATTTAISVSPTTASVAVGATTTITATTTPSGNTVGWVSSNPAVATVATPSGSPSNYGQVTGVAAGTAVITAVSGNYSASTTVTVTAGA